MIGRAMSASTQCPHTQFKADVKVTRTEDTNIKYADITIVCVDCGKPAHFRGCPFGVTPAHPTMAPDGSELRAPFTVGDEDYDGKGMGFVGRQVV